MARADSPEGPFVPVSDGPIPPANFMTLDGTLYVDRAGKPWMVYAHEWLQVTDGKMEAVPLKSDLTAAEGDPVSLFKASDAPWIDEQAVPTTAGARYVSLRNVRHRSIKVHCVDPPHSSPQLKPGEHER